MPLIVDGSAILAYALPDEDDTYASSVIDELSRTEGQVPTVFWYEIWNALYVNISKRKRITLADANDYLSILDELQLTVASPPEHFSLLPLCIEHGLTSYDASYVELAKRDNSPLATLDEKVKSVCRDIGVPVFGED